MLSLVKLKIWGWALRRTVIRNRCRATVCGSLPPAKARKETIWCGFAGMETEPAVFYTGDIQLE